MVAMTEMAAPSQQQQQQPAKPKVKEKKSAAGHSHASGAGAKGRNAVDRKLPDPLELEMARQDLYKVAHPDTQTPFSSLEDACERLLPYHVLAEYELEDVEDKGGSGILLSKAQAWEESLKIKTLEFMATLEKQVILYNSIMKKQWEGEMRGEERMMVEQSLLVEEKQKLANVRAQIEAKEKEEKEAAEAKAKEALANAERARAEAQARAEAHARAEAAQAEAESKAEALRAEADSMVQADSQGRLEDNSDAGPSSEPANMMDISGIDGDGGWMQQDEEDEEDEDAEDDEEEDEDLEGVWDEEGDDDLDEDDDPEILGVTKMLTDYENSLSNPDRASKPS